MTGRHCLDNNKLWKKLHEMHNMLLSASDLNCDTPELKLAQCLCKTDNFENGTVKKETYIYSFIN